MKSLNCRHSIKITHRLGIDISKLKPKTGIESHILYCDFCGKELKEITLNHKDKTFLKKPKSRIIKY